MKINRNMSAVIANTQLLNAEDKLKASIERLSSGYKINSSVDNPAGMAISNKMKAQIDALDQAESNANDGVSVVQIADGALNEVASVLQRMRELAVQGASDSNTYDDRKNIQLEIDQLKKEVDRISTDTEYNTKTLLDGSSDTRIYSDGASRINISDTVGPDNYEVDVTALATSAQADFTIPDTFSTDGEITVNGVTMKVTEGMTKEEFLYEFDQVATEAAAEYQSNEDGTYSLVSILKGGESSISVSYSASLAADFSMTGVTLDAETQTYNYKADGTDAEVTLGDGFSENATAIVKGNRVYIKDSDGFSMDFLLNENVLDEEDEKTIDIDVTDIGRLTIQTGANQYQEMDIRIPEISTESLYLDDVDVSVYEGGSRAITTLDDAIAKLSSVRSRLGAFQNRLEYAVDSLGETSEDMTAAYSQIMDTDMAEEMTEYANQNIIDQAAVSVLSQANDLPQQVLSLLS